MKHFYILPGSVRSHIGAARESVIFRGNTAKHVINAGISVQRAPRHDGSAGKRSRFRAGKSGSYIRDLLFLKLPASCGSNFIIRITGINEDISLPGKLIQLPQHFLSKNAAPADNKQNSRSFQQIYRHLGGSGGKNPHFLNFSDIPVHFIPGHIVQARIIQHGRIPVCAEVKRQIPARFSICNYADVIFIHRSSTPKRFHDFSVPPDYPRYTA